MEAEELVNNLFRHKIEVVADVRSWPRSRHAPWFDRYALACSLQAAGIQYVWLGSELGGRPEKAELYLPDGRVCYDRLADTSAFRAGLRRLRDGMDRMRIAILCSEENPEHCHRRLLVARVLLQDGIEVMHIRRNGEVERERGFVVQTGLFGDEELPWTSTASVLRRRRPRVSSAG